MGLGKTLQAISFLSYLKAQSLSCGPFCAFLSALKVLIVFIIIIKFLIILLPLINAVVMCPLSVTDGWMSEFSKFCSTLRVILYVGDKKHRHNLRNSMHETLQRQSSSSNVAKYFISSFFLELIHLLLQLVELLLPSFLNLH